MMIELRALAAFVAVAEEGHVTRAAERLAMQQPHLSRLLQRIEREFDVELLVRTPRGVRRTAAGEALLADARAILAMSGALPERLIRAARGESGRLALGYTSSASLHPAISDAIRRYRLQYPDVDLSLAEAGTGELMEALARGALDVALVRTPVQNLDDFHVARVLSEPMVVALPAGHRLEKARSKKVRMPALSGEPFVLYRRSSGPGLYDAIVAACRNAGFSPQVVQEAPRLTATLSLVAAGLGVTVVPASMRTLRLDGVEFRDLDASGLFAVIDLVARRNNGNPAAMRFRETLLAAS